MPILKVWCDERGLLRDHARGQSYMAHRTHKEIAEEFAEQEFRRQPFGSLVVMIGPSDGAIWEPQAYRVDALHRLSFVATEVPFKATKISRDFLESLTDQELGYVMERGAQIMSKRLADKAGA